MGAVTGLHEEIGPDQISDTWVRFEKIRQLYSLAM